MDETTRATLKQAYKFIKADKKAEALSLLKDITRTHPDSADVWWLVAFAAPTPDKVVYACKKVLTLAPDHSPAQQLLTEQRRLMVLGAEPTSPVSTQTFPVPEQLKLARQKGPALRSWNLVILLGLLGFVVACLFLVPVIAGINWMRLAGNLPFVGQMFPTPRVTVAPQRTGNKQFPALPPGVEVGSQVDNFPVQTASDPVAGTVEIGKAADYRFYGGAGAELFALIKFVLPLDAKKSLLLLGPDGSPVASSYTPTGPGTAQLSYTLPTDGYYVLRIIGVEGQAQGIFALQMKIYPK